MLIYRIVWSSTQMMPTETYYSDYDLAYNHYCELRSNKYTINIALFEVKSNPKTGLFDTFNCILEDAVDGKYQYVTKENLLPRLDSMEQLATANMKKVFSDWRQHWDLKVSYKCYNAVKNHWKEIMRLIREEIEPQVQRRDTFPEFEDNIIPDDFDFRSDKEKSTITTKKGKTKSTKKKDK